MASRFEVHTRRHPFENDHQSLAVGLAGSEKTQHCSVILYEVSAHPAPPRGNGAAENGPRACIVCRRAMITPTLFADRFVRRGGHRATDLATGEQVCLRVTDAGARQEQGDWTDTRARSLGAGRSRVLIDFGFVGRDRRFEAYRAADKAQRACSGGATPLKPAASQVVEWIETGMSASKVLRVVADGAYSRQWVEALAREVRLRGFVPVCASMLTFHQELSNLLAGRSVVLFDPRGGVGNDGSALCLSILHLLEAKARSVSAIVPMSSAAGHTGIPEMPRMPGLQAAESRPAYGAARRMPAVPLIADARAARWLEEGRRWMDRGRHAAAERSFRAAASAFERRGDVFHSADASMALGRLLLVRGRAEAAEHQFITARDRFQELGAAGDAASACLLAGLSQTDAGKLDQAGATLRAAFTAANALGREEAICRAGVALARNFFWERRIPEGVQLLQAVEYRECPRYWSLLVRLHLAAGHLDAACQCARRAREVLASGSEAQLESVVRTAQALVQARLGDFDALHVHVRAGVEAARVARLPLQSLRLRLTLVEGLLEAGFQSRARAAGRSVRAFSRTALPRLLRERIDRLALQLADTSPVEKGVGCLFPAQAMKKAPDPFFRLGSAPITWTGWRSFCPCVRRWKTSARR